MGEEVADLVSKRLAVAALVLAGGLALTAVLWATRWW